MWARVTSLQGGYTTQKSDAYKKMLVKTRLGNIASSSIQVIAKSYQLKVNGDVWARVTSVRVDTHEIPHKSLMHVK